MSKDTEWINSHAKSYAGKWVALRNGVLIASDDTVKALVDWLSLAGIPRQDVLLTRIDNTPPTARSWYLRWPAAYTTSETRGADASIDWGHGTTVLHLTPERMKQMLRDGQISFT